MGLGFRKSPLCENRVTYFCETEVVDLEDIPERHIGAGSKVSQCCGFPKLNIMTLKNANLNFKLASLTIFEYWSMQRCYCLTIRNL